MGIVFWRRSECVDRREVLVLKRYDTVLIKDNVTSYEDEMSGRYGYVRDLISVFPCVFSNFGTVET